MDISFHQDLCNWAQTDSGTDDEKEESSMDLTHWDPDAEWDPDHKKATLTILAREMKGRSKHCSPRLRKTIIECIKNTKSIDDYIQIPAELNQLFW